MKKIYFLLCGLLMVSSVNAQTITFGSAAFKDALLVAGTTNAYAQDVNGNNMNIDANNNNQIEVSEAANVYKLNVGGWSSVAIIYNITGIEYFVNLRVLDVYGSRISDTDLSVLPHLEELYCNNIGVRTIPSGIILTGLNLKVLECYWTNALIPYLNGTDGHGGLAQFPNLKRLDCAGGSTVSAQLTSLNVSGCSNLEYLSCGNNQLTSLDLTGLNHLTELDCHSNKLTALDLTGLNSLATVNANKNKFTSYTVTGIPNLQTLDLSLNALMTSMTASNLNSLKTLKVETCALTNLTLSGLTALEGLTCQTNHLTSLDLTGFSHLTALTCYANQLTSLTVSGCVNLLNLSCYQNNLTSLDVSGCVNLQTLLCHLNNLSTLDVSNCIKLTVLGCRNNNLTSLFIKNGVLSTTTSDLAINNNPALQYICCDEGELNAVQQQAGPNCNVNSYCSFVPGGNYNVIQGTNKFDNNNINKYDRFDSQHCQFQSTDCKYQK